MKTKQNLSILTIDFGAGGAERVISLLLKHLVNDYNVTLVIFYDYVHYDIPDGVELVVLLPDLKKTNSLFFKVKNTFKLISRYSKLIKEKKIDISLAFLAQPNVINGMMAIRYKNLKTVISERCYPSIVYNYNKFSMPVVKIMFPLFYNRNDKLFSNSVYINKDLQENFKVNLPMSVIYNPIEFTDDKKVNPETITAHPILKAINVGTMEPRKNQKLIIEAMSQLPKSEFHVTFLGTGPLFEDLKIQTIKQDLESQITFEGVVNNVKDYFVESDCFILSSETEGFPNVLLEALSVGLPSISTNCLSGPLELLNDNNPVEIALGDFYKAQFGILVNVDDAKGLAKAMAYFRAHPEVRQHYSKKAFERAKHYSLPKIYEQVKDLLTF